MEETFSLAGKLRLATDARTAQDHILVHSLINGCNISDLQVGEQQATWYCEQQRTRDG